MTDIKRKKISKACAIAAIPYTVFMLFGGFIGALIPTELLSKYIKTEEDLGVLAIIILSIVGLTAVSALVALIVSTVTCGTLGRVIKLSVRNFLRVWTWCPPVVTILLAAFWFQFSWMGFVIPIAFTLVCPSISITLCIRSKFKSLPA